MQTIIDMFEPVPVPSKSLRSFAHLPFCIRAMLRWHEKFFGTTEAVEASVRRGIEGSG